MARITPPTSFSAGRRWGIFFSVMISIVAVAALVVMLNYLAARHFMRFSWSARTSHQLSPATLSLVESITNDVKVTIYYDKTDSLYFDIADLLNEYHLANPKISVQTVDYEVDSAAAMQVAAKYGLGDNKDLLIYECNGQFTITPGKELANYTVDPPTVDDSQPPDASGQPKLKFNRHTAEFDGERSVDADLFRVTGPPLNAYYLTGNGEYPLTLEGRGDYDYCDFAKALSETHITTKTLSLIGTNAIPADCNLLLIANPLHPLAPEELDKVSQYLADGGRLMVLFNNYPVEHVETGLEPILAGWGVQVGRDIVRDPENTAAQGVLVVGNFKTNHPYIGKLVGSTLWMFSPRSISPAKIETSQGQDPPTVVPLAWAGPGAYSSRNGSDYRWPNVPVMVSVEKKNVKGVLQRGTTTRIIVAGDAAFLGKDLIQAAANYDFARQAAGWLLDQTEYMGGIPPRKVVEYKVTITHAQMTRIRWIFLGAMPGGILLLGGLVWLRRRH